MVGLKHCSTSYERAGRGKAETLNSAEESPRFPILRPRDTSALLARSGPDRPAFAKRKDAEAPNGDTFRSEAELQSTPTFLLILARRYAWGVWLTAKQPGSAYSIPTSSPNHGGGRGIRASVSLTAALRRYLALAIKSQHCRAPNVSKRPNANRADLQ